MEPDMLDIVGKNKSILSYPFNFFARRHSIGINQAASLFNTQFGFSAHKSVIKELREHFPDGRLKGITFAAKEIPCDIGHVDGLFEYIKYDPLPLDQGYVSTCVEHALAGDKDFGYRMHSTSLHLLMFWAIYSGYKVVNLMGCNNNPQCLPGETMAQDYVDIPALCRMRLGLIHRIRYCAAPEVIFNIYEDYGEYQRSQP